MTEPSNPTEPKAEEFKTESTYDPDDEIPMGNTSNSEDEDEEESLDYFAKLAKS